MIENNDLIVNELVGFGKFFYRGNGGNMGDSAIATSEIMLFNKLNLDFDIISKSNINSFDLNRFNLVVGGGGGWVEYYNQYYQYPLNKYIRNKNLAKCIVFPSSFYKCDDVVDSFDDRFVVFCRDMKSYEYCLSRNNKAKFILHDDIALTLDVKTINFDNLDDISHELFSVKERIIEYIKSNNSDTANFIRCDFEKTIKAPEKNIDISELCGVFGDDITLKKCLDMTRLMLYAISKFDNIVSNRLHVILLAHLLEKNIIAYDNSYKKISEVYKLSLHNDSKITVKF